MSLELRECDVKGQIIVILAMKNVFLIINRECKGQGLKLYRKKNKQRISIAKKAPYVLTELKVYETSMHAHCCFRKL